MVENVSIRVNITIRARLGSDAPSDFQSWRQRVIVDTEWVKAQVYAFKLLESSKKKRFISHP